MIIETAAQVVQRDPWTLIGNLSTTALVVMAIVGYALDRRIERRERMAGQERYREQNEAGIRRSEQMHTENRERLEQLRLFRDAQERLNLRRDDQISILATLGATASEALKGFNRRLELIEDQAKEARKT